jgi:hypothetical protein
MRHQVISWPTERCAIPLDQAWYCESCRVICNDATCCSCASAEHTQRLAPWLDREPISIPLTGVILSVVPASTKRPREASSTLPPERAPQAS